MGFNSFPGSVAGQADPLWGAGNPTGGVGGWVAFPAVYATTGADGSIGDGTFTATYRREGKAVRVCFLLILGATTVLGASDMLVPFPVGAVPDPDGSPVAQFAPGFGAVPAKLGTPSAAIASGAALTLCLFAGSLVTCNVNQNPGWTSPGDAVIVDLLIPVL